jgi:hypothetical protein
LDKASGIPIFILLKGKTSAYSAHFYVHKNFEERGIKSFSNSSKLVV